MTALKELTEADLYHVFSIERRGDTLIVAPRGDASSFPEHHFRSAVTALRRRLDGTHPCRLIVDLSDVDYPGLAMLDVFDDLITEVGWRGETVVVAGASDDTVRVLKEYGLGHDWKHFEDLPAAAKAIVHEPFWKPAARRPDLVAAAVLIVLLIVGAAAFWAGKPHPDRVAYNEIQEIWNDYAGIQATVAEEPDLIAATAEVSRRSDELATYVAERRRMPEIIAAAKQLQRMLHRPKIKDDLNDRKLADLLVAARDRLDQAGR
ncbi:MAG: STAS domain-containing protein [Planctomycetaceae bacterium]